MVRNQSRRSPTRTDDGARSRPAAGPSRGRRSQKQRRAETERRVLDAAITLIAQHGSRALTLAEVGEAAGYSRGIVSHHFGGREQLLRAVMEDARTFALPEQKPNAAAVEWLTDVVVAYLKNITSRTPAARAFLQMWGEAIAADPVLVPLFAEQDASFRRLLTENIQDGIADGSVRSDINPSAAAVALVGFLRGIGLQLIATPPPRNPTSIITEAERMTRLALQPDSAETPGTSGRKQRAGDSRES